ncbi:MAG: hypothetical protein IKS65_00725 [Bacteroidales bacterium]|nr:hypothetical protein [Bacteroidales bacterium]
MKTPLLHIILILCALLASCTQDNYVVTSPTSPEDAAYTRLLDSIDSIVEGFYYYDFNDSIIMPALEFYKGNDSRRNLWMQARCHYLIGVLQFGENHVSEKAAKNMVEALKILDENFDDYLLHSKIHYVISKIAFNFSNGSACKRLAAMGLDCATQANDTAWMARSCSNLGIIYERMGKAGEGDTAYMYCDQGMRLADANRYPLERAYLENTYANCLRHSHQYDSAIYHFNIAKSLINNDILLYHKTYLEEAFVYYQKHDYQTAIAELEVAFQTPDHNIRHQSATGLADCWEKVGDTMKAAPYFSIMKASNEKDIVQRHYNTNAMPVLESYLKSLDETEKNNNIVWLIAVVLIAMATVAAVYYGWKKRHLNTLKDKDYETLRLKGRAIFSDRHNNKMERIRNEFNAAYPEALAKLSTAHPELSDTELDICVLSFFSFRLKETSEIMHLRENTVAKYRTAIKKKVKTDDLETIFH